ncbi:phosphonopyruvate decarboxylase [Leptospira santarosai]|uniref:phosphonopyruvate decarboxylase n=1 Tax=Leptospira santarosai TaxID=28183 RepID=UPI0024AEDB99|nr:phosphonopyruvate decarboxylase [Leptospira santarosai]MDI7174958.1 phosphonopyruvate decarboxylase [Leptospira santarosai]MDI7194540.1 phosphonopyruvate decarboxylase [Leptospira santarosai]MDO6399009.1 phosphonopyruvate decarboxylase [Leptospira santarosai]MDO6404382.1 phosphonopyruvate decarboxylase [Leptospira santarosai]
MISSEFLVNNLFNYGFDFYSGVPCSILKGLINQCAKSAKFVRATNEGDAVAICAGAYLGGKKPVVMMQNSGLSNAISPLASLNFPFQIPVLGFISLRGDQEIGDEPQHELIGKITIDLLNALKIDWEILSSDSQLLEEQIRRANDSIEKHKSFWFIVKKGSIDEFPSQEGELEYKSFAVASSESKIEYSNFFFRKDILQILDKRRREDTFIITTTGYTSREMYEIRDHVNNFYMVGSMGCAGSIGLGLALAQPDKKVIVIDGDGALLMRLGSMTSNAMYHPNNLLHILLDNGCHESTGGQLTTAGVVDFTALARACGYPQSIRFDDLGEFEEFFEQWQINSTLTFALFRTKVITLNFVGRPKTMPSEVTKRFHQTVNTSKMKI